MEFGFSLPSRGQAATMQNMRLLAQHVEALGFDSVWVSDHIIVPRHIDSFYPYDPEGRFPSAPDQAYYEPLTTLAFLAACTTRVQLGTSVLILPYRNALLTAKIVSTLDALSGGRVILGIGVGWMEEEFDALGLDTFHQRGEVSDEYIQVFFPCGRASSQVLLAATCALRTLVSRPNQPASRIRRSGSVGTRLPPFAVRRVWETAGIPLACVHRPASHPLRCARPLPACAMRPARPAAIRGTLLFPSVRLLPSLMTAAPRASP